MRVYVESNFILELAFLREEHSFCLDMLELAEQNQLRLVIPAFCLGEPYEAMVRRAKKRRELHEQLSAEIRELARSEPYHEIPREVQQLTALLLESGEAEKRRLDERLRQVVDVAEIAQTDRAVINTAIDFQRERSLSPQDSIVYASIIAHLKVVGMDSESSCFITKNPKDFNNPDIIDDLSLYRCRAFWRFENGLGFINSTML